MNPKKLKKETELPIISESPYEEPFLHKIPFQKIKQPSIKEIKTYKVSFYDEICEDYSKIKEIIPISYSFIKIFFFFFLSISTLFIINFLTIWFPILKIIFIYKKTSLKNASFVCVIGVDSKIYIIDLKKIIVTKKLNESHFLRRQFNTNIPFDEDELYLFKFKLFKYIYIPDKGTFEGIDLKLESSLEQIHKNCSQGLSNDEVSYMKEIFGECDLKIEIKSYFKLLIDELSDPFYLFQIFSIILWYNDDYEYFATIIVFSTLISLFTSTYNNRRTLILLYNIAKYSCLINVYRKNDKGIKELNQILSTDLVPGDLIDVPEYNIIIPCDCLLLSGTAIVDEVMLTGENIPIFKNHLLKSYDIYNEDKGEKSFLFAGTKIIQKRRQNKEKVTALVHYTGFETWKGNLIRGILYPKNEGIESRNDTMKYMIFMSFIYLLGLSIVLPILVNIKIPLNDIIIKSLDLATTTVPPSLPTCLGIGISFSINRLSKKGIICINRDKVNTAGKVNMICLDKTGTLTEGNLNVFGFRQVMLNKNDQFIFGNFIKSIKNYSQRAYRYYKEKRLKKIISKNEDLNQIFIECIASCHTVTSINNKLMGDPIDIKMFESSDWIIMDNNSEKDSIINTYLRYKKEKPLQEEIGQISNILDEEKIIKSHYEIGVVRKFEFSNTLQRMSVLVRDINDNYFKVFTKGSPEQIRDLCIPESIPLDFNDVLKKYTMKGLRVLAFSFKNVKLSFIESQNVKREKLENNMIFLGLIIVQNQLKPETIETIEILNKAKIRLAMVTGDYIFTAISVARQCEIINPDSIVYNCDIIDNKLVWNLIEQFDNDEDDFEEKDELNDLILGPEEEEIILGINRSNTLPVKSNLLKQMKKIKKVKRKTKFQEDEINTSNQNNQDLKNQNSSSFLKDYQNIKPILKSHKESFNNPQPSHKESITFSIQTEKTHKESINTIESSSKHISIPETVKTEPKNSSLIKFDIIPLKLNDRRNSFTFRYPPENLIFSRKASALENVTPELPILHGRQNSSSSSSSMSLLNIEIKNNPFKDILSEYNISNLNNIIVSIRGNVFEYFFKLRNKYLETNDIKYKKAYEIFQIIIKYGKIFSRMNPDHKAMLIASLQDENLTVLMCGDGSNDVPALRTADVGVSLTNEESSIAAPFNSNKDNISCLIDLIREGKCSLATTIQIFKYMIVYSFIQFLTVVLLFMNNSYLTDFQFIIVDIFIILPLASLSPMTQPYRRLTKHQLNGNFVNFNIIISIFSQVFICLFFLIVGIYFLKKRIWYKPMCKLTEKNVFECPENTVIYLISHMQYLITAFVFIISKPFKRRFYTNYPLTIFIIFTFIYSIFIIINPDKYSRYALSLFDFEDEKNHQFSDGYFQVVIFLICLSNFVVSYFFEKVIVPLLTKMWYKRKNHILKEKMIENPSFELTLGQIQQFRVSKLG